jgi:hypothetical protein
MKKLAKVCMLSAKDKGVLLKGVYPPNNEPLEILSTQDKEWERFGKPQHLYFTIDERPENGDWYIYNNELLRQQNDDYNPSAKLVSKNRKIVATTDFLLLKSKDEFSSTHDRVAQIPQSFVEEYVKAGGIDEVLLEYDKLIIDEKTGEQIHYFGFEFDDAVDAGYVIPRESITLKTDKNNCVIIHPVKPRLYTEEEVESKCRYAWQVGYNVGYNDELSPSGLTADDWIKENLF